MPVTVQNKVINLTLLYKKPTVLEVLMSLSTQQLSSNEGAHDSIGVLSVTKVKQLEDLAVHSLTFQYAQAQRFLA